MVLERLQLVQQIAKLVMLMAVQNAKARNMPIPHVQPAMLNARNANRLTNAKLATLAITEQTQEHVHCVEALVLHAHQIAYAQLATQAII